MCADCRERALFSKTAAVDDPSARHARRTNLLSNGDARRLATTAERVIYLATAIVGCCIGDDRRLRFAVKVARARAAASSSLLNLCSSPPCADFTPSYSCHRLVGELAAVSAIVAYTQRHDSESTIVVIKDERERDCHRRATAIVTAENAYVC